MREQRASDATALKVGVDIEHVDVAVWLNVREASDAMFAFSDPGRLGCASSCECIVIDQVRRPSLHLRVRIVTPSDEPDETSKESDQVRNVIGLTRPDCDCKHVVSAASVRAVQCDRRGFETTPEVSQLSVTTCK
jgi:hypothetical protein